jgi:hypothetical protein
MLMPKFELRTNSAKHVAFVEADNIESVFEMNGRLILVTIDGKEYRFDHMEYVVQQEKTNV